MSTTQRTALKALGAPGVAAAVTGCSGDSDGGDQTTDQTTTPPPTVDRVAADPRDVPPPVVSLASSPNSGSRIVVSSALRARSLPAERVRGNTPDRRGRTAGVSTTDLTARLDAPTDRPTEELDVRQAPPPEPLTRTLERLATLSDGDDDPVVLQHNDRRPEHLFPKLADRGYEFDCVETDDRVVTAIRRP